MKSLLTILSFLFITMNFTNCAAQKEVTNNYEVTYDAMTRGRSVNMKITGNNMHYKTQQDTSTHNLTSDDCKALEKEISKIDLKSMSELKAPTNKRAFDGAMHTTITIKKGESSFVSCTFDDTDPPVELEALVKLLHSFKK